MWEKVFERNMLVTLPLATINFVLFAFNNLKCTHLDRK